MALFRDLSFNRALGRSVLNSRPLSYTRAMELFRHKLTSLGHNAKNYGLHSLRSGGATMAAANHIPDRLIKIHGRWRSDSSKDRYIQHTTQARIDLVTNLGL